MSEPEVRVIPAASVIFDSTFYVRWALDNVNVRRLAEVMAQHEANPPLPGDEVPPIAVQIPSQRVIYGVHRLHAAIRLHGETAVIRARFYEVDDRTAIRMALAENARHGLPFRPIDVQRATILAERHGLSDEEVVRALHMPPGRLMDLRARRGLYTRGGLALPEQVPLKRSMLHLSQQELTTDQYEVVPHAPGVPVTMLARQIVQLIVAGAINQQDDKARLALLSLQQALATLDLLTTWGEASDDGITARGESVPIAS